MWSYMMCLRQLLDLERLKIPEGVEVESSGAEEADTEAPEQQDEESMAPKRRSQRVKLVPKKQKNYTGGEELDEILDKLKSPSPKARKIKQMRAKYGKNQHLISIF